ncbi:MAG: phosphoenolpyruvate carboxykinase (GTP) [Candidatus Omnitrophica bacterium]|nr:phosphoenolpyruvate carboxykinase (GTP) [Candidatus Omnitrophota bacterium]
MAEAVRGSKTSSSLEGRTMTKHKRLIGWVDEMAKLCQPDRVVWCDGSEEEKKRLEQESLARGELIELNPAKLPGCFLHRTAHNDVARTENLTFICTLKKEDAGPNNNWMSPNEAYAKAGAIFRGAMKGRTLYVIPFCMGPVGSPFSKIGIELTDSVYVVLNMRIMTRMGKAVLDALGTNGEFTKGLHSKADLDLNRRLILHFPEDNAIWSVGSGYGGNVLLGKKCLALRIGSWLGAKEGWMAEHMLILGIEKPNGDIKYITAAFPSACGKTNLAMIVPPEGLKHKGYKIWTVGDDIAWLRIGKDGQLRAVNPEAGFFGVLPGTNSKTNFVATQTMKKNTIYTNVVLTPDKTVWWEGGDGEPPAQGIDWKGNPWKPGMKDQEGKPVLGAHPNSRFTAPINQCPTFTSKMDDPEGVPISAIIFGGRRARVAPLVYESFNWQHGVYVGSQMASERTAAQYGKQGEVRRDPMAMLPFCGYNMADYFKHWLSMGRKIKTPPKIFHVNWFRQNEQGEFMWPGFGDNLRVLEWILARVEGKGEAEETPIGYVPKPSAIDLTGLDVTSQTMKELFSIDTNEWLDDLKLQEEFYAQFGNRLPKEISQELTNLKQRLSRS